MKLVFATTNLHKLEEARNILPSTIEIISASDAGFNEEIIEDADTFEGNAELKALAIHKFTGLPTLADDSGLMVDALNGLPGVKSARFANQDGPVDHNANNLKLLSALQGITSRSASFRTALCFIDQFGEKHFFHGIVNGTITEESFGDKGFGYDPLFIPTGYTETFGVLGKEIKNAVSHRANALNEFAKFLES